MKKYFLKERVVQLREVPILDIVESLELKQSETDPNLFQCPNSEAHINGDSTQD